MRLIVLAASCAATATGFSTLPHQKLRKSSVPSYVDRTPCTSYSIPYVKPCETQVSQRLPKLYSSLAIPGTVTKVFPPAVKLALLGTFALMLLTRLQPERLLYPNVVKDDDFDEPLPPGKIDGCPFIGSTSAFADANTFLYKRAASLSKGGSTPRIWKYFGFFKPTAVLSGSSVIKRVLNKEFKEDSRTGEGAVSQITSFGSLEELFGTDSLSFETKSKDRYHAVRSLVGQAMTPKAVAEGIPALQASAERAISRITQANGQHIAVEDICKDLTLDVSWRQIIGLNLKDEKEITEFYEKINEWMKGIVNFSVMLFPRWIVNRMKCVKAKKFLTQKVEEKIDELLAKGPDGSTMSSMLFAKDEEDGHKAVKLTRKEVIDNIFLLIVAGSETSANTLTCALLLLGMYPHVYEKLVAEQTEIVAKYGDKLSKEQLEESVSPYLDAVLKETMRLMPITGGGMRQVDETIVIDGVQIPKDWYILYSVSLTHKQDPVTQEPDGSDNMSIYSAYRPERWLDDKTRPSSEFIPWGAGHRFCLGHTLATAEMKVFLATFARKVKSFDLITDPASKWKWGIIKTPADGVVVVPHTNGVSSIKEVASEKVMA